MSRLRLDAEIPLGTQPLKLSFETTHQVTGVFGPSGCGKTSLLRFVAGLRPGSGTLAWGEEVWQGAAGFVPPEARGVGYVPQGSLLFPHLDVRGNLLAGARRAQRAGQDAERTLARVVDLLEVGDLLARGVGGLSGGEAQRVALGRALCSAPRLLLLDEPLAGLDLALKHRVLPFLRRVRDEYEIPMLLVSHDPTEVQALCDDLLVIGDGGLVARGAPRTTLVDPAVLGGAPPGQLESLLECEVVEVGAGVCRVRAGTTALTCLPTSGQVGDRKLLLVSARDVILASREPTGLSARNTVPARIERLDVHPDGRLVGLRLGGEGGPSLRSYISAEAWSGLGLEVGGEVYAVIKASCCTLLDR